MSEQATTEAPVNQQTNATQTAQSAETTASAATTEQGTAATTAGAGTMDGGGKETAAANTETAADGELQKLRVLLAAGDEGTLKALERYKTTEAISKAFKEGRDAAKRTSKPLTLSEKANEEELKAYRAAAGIPDEPKDYPANFRDDFKATDADKAILSSFKEYLHGKAGDPRTANAALEWYQDFATSQQQELAATLAKTAKETQAALRNEWGGEYDGNINAAAELMKSQLGEEGFTSMMDLRLMDGSRLQDNPAFVKMMANLGQDYYGGNSIMTGDVESTSKTVQERIDELMALRASDSAKYFSDDVQAKLSKLYAQKQKLSARK